MEEKKKDSIRVRLEHMTKDKFIVLLLFGVLLLVIVWPAEPKNNKNIWDTEQGKTEGTTQISGAESAEKDRIEAEDYARYLEQALEEILTTVEGVGKVRVMIIMEDYGKAIVEKDQGSTRSGSTEVDSAGGSRNTTDIVYTETTIYTGSHSGENVPYVTQTLVPKIAGVLVSAQGGENAAVVRNISDAIQALFGIPSHKIKIVKMIS